MNLVKIQGGCSLNGTVKVGGAKNAALLMLSAALLTEEVCILRNVPVLSDINFLIQILQHLGVEVTALDAHTWQLKSKNISHKAPYELVRQMRASVCLLGPLVGRLRKACVSLPGGCVIGHRPIDLHLKGLQKMGCDISLTDGNVNIVADKLNGAHVFLGGRYGSTVTGTANILMAAVLSPGCTTIESAACEPEIVDLCHLLVQMGASIDGIGSPCIVVHGCSQLKGFDYQVIGDRIEAGTFVIAGVLTKGSLRVEGFTPSNIGALMHLLETSGAQVNVEETAVTVFPSERPLSSFEVTTLPYPGFATDLQAQMCVLAATIPGLSLITEKIYPNRFMHVPELERLGANIVLEGPTAIVQGNGHSLRGANVMASDLRASAALYLAGLIAEGETTIHRVYHVDRGYENFDQKLKNLGAKLERGQETL